MRRERARAPVRSLGTALLALCLAPAAPGASTQDQEAERAERRLHGEIRTVPFQEPALEGMHYQLFIPRGAGPDQRHPLVLALHGNGQSARAHLRTMARLSRPDRPVFVVAPQYQKGTEFNDPVHTEAARALRASLEEVLRQHPVDRRRVVLQGFSMGAVYAGALAYGWHREDPETFPFRGVWMNGTAVPPREGKPLEVPFLLFVGERETAVRGNINVVRSVRAAYRAMFRLGMDVVYLEIPRMGHTVDGRCLDLMGEFLDRLPPGPGQEGLESWARRRLAQRPPARDAKALLALHEEFEALAREWEDHETLGPLARAALARLERVAALRPELEARQRFQDARMVFLHDEAAGTGMFEDLAGGALAETAFGRRAAGHLQALQDSPDPAPGGEEGG